MAAPPGYPGAAYPGAPPPAPGAVAPSQGQFFSSPEGFQSNPGQASYNEQDDFNDPTGKYKLVMKGSTLSILL